jgi:hypothetical protein
VSAFSYLQKQRLGKGRDAIWADKNIANTTINEFVYTLERPLVAKRVLRFVHLIPQYKWLSDEELDFVGRFENLEYDFRYVAKVLDIDPVLQHARRSEHGPYHEHLNKRSMSVINNLYYEDFKRFGY